MRNALALACGVLAITVACSRNYNPDPDMQPDPGKGKSYVVTTTGAAVGVDDPSASGVPEPMLGDLALRLARQICDRELRCRGDVTGEEQCLRAYNARATGELGRWNCSPAAARARVEQCLAAVDDEPCELDLATRRRLCGTNVACPDPDRKLIPPGALLGPISP